ncbi:patatin-like protein 2 [Amborella trichopoda]|uniref:patatin-like protein 2 n=1 Tax=Amborella trichopoda TaxID=13333 RepID=UPI0009BEE51C|nr:patatin-like protein 2 [Amborella trichopoda]|eukprot:XP_020517536.1 patatin-like protein 2 [Amborella trichopoda]
MVGLLKDPIWVKPGLVSAHFQPHRGPFSSALKMMNAVLGPKYDGKYLRSLLKDGSTSKDALLSDTCISTSAAPTYVLAHYFENKGSGGEVRFFHLIDGGVAANNPTLVAISEVTKELSRDNPDFFQTKPLDYAQFLVISLGTGSVKTQEIYSAKAAAGWGVLRWLYNKGNSPLVDTLSQASADMVDVHNSIVFQALKSKDNFLRIQV